MSDSFFWWYYIETRFLSRDSCYGQAYKAKFRLANVKKLQPTLKSVFLPVFDSSRLNVPIKIGIPSIVDPFLQERL